jgi:hypothetical protein
MIQEPSKLKKGVSAGALLVVMFMWGLHLAYPMQHLQYLRCDFFGYSVPVYYFLTVLLTAGPAASVVALKRRWGKWELLWWALPVICLPGIAASADFLWSARQWLSWAIRGVIPGGVIFLVAQRKRSDSILLYWIYPIILAAALLGLAELYFNYNPLYHYPFYYYPADHYRIADFFYSRIPPISEASNANPFYRPAYEYAWSAMPMGTQGNRIPYAATLVCFLPLGMWHLKYSRRLYWAHLAGVGMLAAILLCAQVRSSWAAMLAALILMQAAGLLGNRRQAAEKMAGFFLFLSAFLIWPSSRARLWPRLNSFHSAELSIRSRIAVLKTAAILKDHWLFGVGFGQFPTACKPYYQSTLRWSGTPDDQYVRWAIENGILSLILLSVFLIGLVRAAWKEIQKIKDVRQADFYKSLLIGWLSLAVTFLFFDGFYWGACNMTFWCFLGLIATCLSPESGQAGAPAKKYN